MNAHQLISIFCEIDDFCKEFDQYAEHYFLTGPEKGKRGPKCCLAVSEIMTILVMFQMSKYRDFKSFYKGLLCMVYKPYFPHVPSYERFVNL